MRKLNDAEKAQMREIADLKFCAGCRRCKASPTRKHNGKLHIEYFCVPQEPQTVSFAAFKRHIGAFPLRAALGVAHRNVAFSSDSFLSIVCSGHSDIRQRPDCSFYRERIADELKTMEKESRRVNA